MDINFLTETPKGKKILIELFYMHKNRLFEESPEESLTKQEILATIIRSEHGTSDYVRVGDKVECTADCFDKEGNKLCETGNQYTVNSYHGYTKDFITLSFVETGRGGFPSTSFKPLGKSIYTVEELADIYGESFFADCEAAKERVLIKQERRKKEIEELIEKYSKFSLSDIKSGDVIESADEYFAVAVDVNGEIHFFFECGEMMTPEDFDSELRCIDESYPEEEQRTFDIVAAYRGVEGFRELRSGFCDEVLYEQVDRFISEAESEE